MSDNSFIPSEVTYEPEPSPEPVVVTRTERTISSPNPMHDSATSSVIRFKIDSSQMVDLASLKMYAKVVCTHGGGNTGVVGTGTASTKAILNSSYSLFSSVQISTGSGQVIERISDADVLGEIVSKMSFSDKWSRSSGSFQNAQKIGYMRDNGTGWEFEMGVLHLLGFLKSGKAMIPESVGGLVLELTMNPYQRVFVGRAPTDTFTFGLQSSKLIYDELLMSQSYMDWYRSQYATRGFRINFTTYQGHSSQVVTSTENQSVHLALSGKRTKALVTCVRPVPAIDSISSKSQALMAPTLLRSFQYQVGSERFPPAPVDSLTRAHSEALKISLAHGNVQREVSSLTDWATNWELGTGEHPGQHYGAFVLAVDTEKLSSSDKSGVVVPPSGAQLQFDLVASLAGDYRVDTFQIRDQSLTIIGGQVQVDY